MLSTVHVAVHVHANHLATVCAFWELWTPPLQTVCTSTICEKKIQLLASNIHVHYHQPACRRTAVRAHGITLNSG